MEDFFKLSILIVTRANKKDSLGGTVLFGEGISLIMGCSKKYNVLGGFYINYSITLPPISVAKLSRNILRFFVHFIQSVYSTLCTTSFSLFSSSKRASNSSLEIFSFSRRSDALLSRISLFSEIIVFARE